MAEGDLTHKLDIDHKDEVGVLAASLNAIPHLLENLLTVRK
ncbi:MAG: HAMP domain-containing protein [Desulforhopalus sp.]